MDLFFRIFEHLLPKGRAWRVIVEKCLTNFFRGLTGLGIEVRLFFDQVWEDMDPQLTRQLPEFEDQFALPNSGLLEPERRDRLDARWKAKGGQDPRYIEDTLRAAGFDVYIHEWWDPDNLFHPGYAMCAGAENAIAGNANAVSGGGIIDGIIRSPVARAPRTYLSDSLTQQGFLVSAGAAGAIARAKVLQTAGMVAGGTTAIAGHASASAGLSTYLYPSVAGARIAPAGYPLVNILMESTLGTIGAGQLQAVAGGAFAVAGAQQRGEIRKEYTIPDGAQYWPYFLYIGGQTFPEVANVSANRKLEFETLCLQICPTQLWLGILVQYN